ncbi:MAG TPA: RluA family pseudouridine synthase [Leptolyngbyaceae cyanobacterium]
MLHPLNHFISQDTTRFDADVDYWYEGRCPYTRQVLRLPRTRVACAIAQALMAQLEVERGRDIEGKMYGILLVQTIEGDLGVLKAFSGLLEGKSQIEGWVPSIPGREQVAQSEAKTLAALDQIKQRLIQLQQLPERAQLTGQSQRFMTQLQVLNLRHNQRKQERQVQRQQVQALLQGETLAESLEALDEQSRRDGLERRRLKQERDRVLGPLQAAIATADAEILALKRQRKDLSRQLQAQMHETYRLTNFAGKSQSIEALAHRIALPTGTGDCCAPKLLQYAANHGLTPIAMAEFWWGRPSTKGDRIPGQFYGACEERCQPIMGFLLSGLSSLGRNRQLLSHSLAAHSTTETATSLPILYEDQWLIAIDKPTGLLSVPGRYLDSQDSVLSRLRFTVNHGTNLFAVHRLDQDTSGILLLARDRVTYQHLSHQFQQRQVQKTYEAVLEGSIHKSAGLIDLPLWADPDDRPLQKVDWQKGKISQTYFQVISQNSASPSSSTRVEFFPITGRTHQLRVHAADPQGLGVPIRGDRLYSPNPQSPVLHLHARELRFTHPQTGKLIHLFSKTPF